MKNEKDLNKIENQIKGYRAAAFTSIFLGFLCIAVVWHQNKYIHPMQWNEVGDYLGGTMVGFWSLAGLFFIYVAFLGQRLDIQLTKQELAETRIIQAKQAATQSMQQFENLFFSLIDTHLKIVDDLDTSFTFLKPPNYIGEETKQSKGRDVFKDSYEIYLKEITPGKRRISEYGILYAKKKAEYGHYYRFLYRIIDTIDRHNFISNTEKTVSNKIEDDKINFKTRYEYTNIVRALLSDEELEMLFYNMLYYKDLKFKNLIEKYCLLKNIEGGQQKIENEEYDFHPGAINKKLNPNFQ